MIPMSGYTMHSCNLHVKVVHGEIKRTALNSTFDVQKTLCFLSMKLACNLICDVYVIGICRLWYNFSSTL